MKTIRICELPITVFENENYVTELVTLFNSNKPVSFHGYSIDTLYLMKHIPNLYKMREINDYFLCDGRGFYYFMKMLGVNGVVKLSLPALTFKLISLAKNYNKSIYLLGATNDSNYNAQVKINKVHGVKEVYGRNGYYSIEEESSIVESINNIAPDILFLGMSSPKKDEFLYKWKDKLNVKIIIHCGGMIDILSGKTKLYPKWVKELCLAALYRFIQEPIRLRRDINNAIKSLFLIFKVLFIVKIMGRDFDFRKLFN